MLKLFRVLQSLQAHENKSSVYEKFQLSYPQFWYAVFAVFPTQLSILVLEFPSTDDISKQLDGKEWLVLDSSREERKKNKNIGKVEVSSSSSSRLLAVA